MEQSGVLWDRGHHLRMKGVGMGWRDPSWDGGDHHKMEGTIVGWKRQQ